MSTLALARGYPARTRAVQVPWSSLRDRPDEFFEEGVIPEGVRLADPSHMNSKHLNPLWQAILERQELYGPGEEVFAFSQVMDNGEPVAAR